MGRYVALLRAVNVGGVKVDMAELRALAEDLGFEDVVTVRATGNLVLTADADAAELRSRLEAALEDRYGRAVPVAVRTPEELRDVLDRAEDDQVVGFLLDAPVDDAPARIEGPDGETGVLHGRELLLRYPNGQGRSKLTAARIERELGSPVTVRGVGTIAAVLERC